MLMHTGLTSTHPIHADPLDTGPLDTGPLDTGPRDAGESRAGSGGTGFLELILSDGELLDAEFQELIGRILPPSRIGVPVLASTAGWGRKRLSLPGGSGTPPRRGHSSRTPPPARERSPPRHEGQVSGPRSTHRMAGSEPLPGRRPCRQCSFPSRVLLDTLRAVAPT